MLPIIRTLQSSVQTGLKPCHLLYVLDESEVVARKSSIKMVFLKIPQNSQENICVVVSFAIKLQAGGLQLH